MNRIKWQLNSYGTISGVCRNYDADGVDQGPLSLIGYGVFFAVREKIGFNDGAFLFKKSVGTGITLTAGSLGSFAVTIQSGNVNRNPSEYGYECFISSSGTAFVDGTTELKSVGSGIFEITPGAKYGTA